MRLGQRRAVPTLLRVNRRSISYIHLARAIAAATATATVALGWAPTARASKLSWLREPITAVRIDQDLPGTRTVGRLFATHPNGATAYCTGTVIRSANQSVVLTAGHCIHGGPGGDYFKNIAFAPGLRPDASGAAQEPYGRWPAVAAMTTSDWIRHGSVRGRVHGDVGMVVLAHDPLGRSITQVLGEAHRIKFNVRRTRRTTVYGYPADGRFLGNQALNGCVNRPTGLVRTMDGRGPLALGMRCEMLHGASGGPWIRRADANAFGTVVTVTSLAYLSAKVTAGPVLGRAARRLFRVAQKIS